MKYLGEAGESSLMDVWPGHNVCRRMQESRKQPKASDSVSVSKEYAQQTSKA